MGFRDREKERLNILKSRLFTRPACKNGTYAGTPRDFCLADECSTENLHPLIRAEAIDYFRNRRIPWHDGSAGSDGQKRALPSNHLCCSQSACVNFWFPFVRDPVNLKKVLSALGYSVSKILPFNLDGDLPGGGLPLVAFEWIGEKNYLGEGSGGKAAPDQSRSRGALFTSTDFAIRFRQKDNRIRILLGEWKYSERYEIGNDRRLSGKTDRLSTIYRKSLEHFKSQIRMPKGIGYEALFFEPFDQLMRQQLLASAMERAGEMDADIVSLIHIAPRANKELVARITSPDISHLGSDIHEIWSSLTVSDRFKGVYTEELLPIVARFAPDPKWAEYLELRYGLGA